jgi:UDP-2-acetamido-3-amino-2,3-dideoxy-glucuronate N-acetyltransferase
MAKNLKKKYRGVRIHPTANIEEDVTIGPDSAIWDHVHIRPKSRLGHHCIVGEKSYIAYNVRIGNYVKINAFVYIPTGITVEDKVMISAGAIFVNDKYPKAFDYERGELKGSGPGDETQKTLVCEGSSIGAGAIVLGGLRLGRFCMVGAGSVVTTPVADHALVVGSPAQQIGWVCVCGHRLKPAQKSRYSCTGCRRVYALKKGAISPI